MNEKEKIHEIVSEADMAQVINNIKNDYMIHLKGRIVPNADEKELFERCEKAAREAIEQELQKAQPERASGTLYHVIRIDYSYDPARTSKEDAGQYALQMAIYRAMAASGTIEQGISISAVQDCGESI